MNTRHVATGSMSRLLMFAVSLALVACSDASRQPGSEPTTTDSAAGDMPPAATARVPELLANATRDPCVIAAVTDGDSLRCTDQRRIRLLLLDAPEMSQDPFGARSRDALRALLRRGDTLWLEYDVQRKDQYGRTLAHGWTAAQGGKHVNLQQARDGWVMAVVFPPNVRYVEIIREAVAEARRERRGLWRDGRFSCTPADHKRGRC